MFTAAPGDVILRASIDGAFHVLDAISLEIMPPEGEYSVAPSGVGQSQ